MTDKFIISKKSNLEPDKMKLIEAAYVAFLNEKEFVSGEAVNAWVASWGMDKELQSPSPDIFKSH